LPAFSHDGRQLAYACFLPEGDFALSIATAQGLAPKIVKNFSGWINGLTWSGDDKRLVFSQAKPGDARAQLRELTIADGSDRDLPFAGGANWPDISASGERLVYGVESGGNNTIWRADLLHPENSPVKLISSTREQACPQYSPDGKHIAFSSSRGGSSELWMSDPDGTNLVPLSNLRNLVTGTPSWSPDNRRIVFDSWTGDHPDIYIVDIAERAPRKLSVSTGQASVPSWSRDGRWIYFIGGGRAQGERVYRVPPEGGRAQVLTSARGYGPEESFDGQGLYFAVPPGTLEFATLNPTGTEYRVEGMPPLSFVANWTIVRGGVYFFPAGAFKTLSYFDFATKQTREVLTVSSGAFFGLSVSSDGRYLLYTQIEDHRGDIMLVDQFR
jgi:Tol biopolymer transport system component